MVFILLKVSIFSSIFPYCNHPLGKIMLRVSVTQKTCLHLITWQNKSTATPINLSGFKILLVGLPVVCTLAHFQHIVLSVLSFSFPKGIIIERRKNECTFCFSHPVNNKATFFSLLMSLCTLPSPHEQSCSLVTHERGLIIAFVYLLYEISLFQIVQPRLQTQLSPLAVYVNI